MLEYVLLSSRIRFKKIICQVFHESPSRRQKTKKNQKNKKKKACLQVFTTCT